MDSHSFGREGSTNFDDIHFLKRQFEDPRKPPKYIDTTQVPHDYNDMPGVWSKYLGEILLYAIISIVITGDIFYKLFYK
jgi:hypothetical protein